MIYSHVYKGYWPGLLCRLATQLPMQHDLFSCIQELMARSTPGRLFQQLLALLPPSALLTCINKYPGAVAFVLPKRNICWLTVCRNEMSKQKAKEALHCTICIAKLVNEWKSKPVIVLRFKILSPPPPTSSKGESLLWGHIFPFCSRENRSQNKRTFITPSHGLFLTCRGEKYTVLIQCCTIYNDLSIWIFKWKNP